MVPTSCFAASAAASLILILSTSVSSGPLPLSSSSNSILQDLFTSPQVFLTISSLATTLPNLTTTDRQLVLNWENLDLATGTYISLLSHNTPLLTQQISSPSGSMTTTFKYPHYDSIPTTLSKTTPTCTEFTITHHADLSDPITSPLTSSCLPLHSSWMTSLAEIINPLPLTSLFIPGTHDAGAYMKFNSSNDNPITKYVITQEDSILSQLIHGIRYLDIRAGYYPSTPERFWLNHGDARVRPMIDVIQQVNEFHEAHPQELVIFDLHGFPVGFNQSVHEIFVEFLVSSFPAETLVPKSLPRPLTYGGITSGGYNVLIGYADREVQEAHPLLDTNVEHAWADTTSVDDLKSYQLDALDKNGCGGSSGLWSAMVELTPTASDIITRPMYGLRGFANEVNPELSGWYSTEEFYGRANIVASDFFLENNLISIAVTVNQGRNLTMCL